MYGERLKILRKLAKETQEDVANLLGLKEKTYTVYETENQFIPLKYLNILVKHYNVSFDYLFAFTDKKRYENSREKIELKKSGERLYELRIVNSLSQKSMGALLNLSAKTICNYERGTNMISTYFLFEVAKKYKISADYLLAKIDTPKEL